VVEVVGMELARGGSSCAYACVMFAIAPSASVLRYTLGNGMMCKEAKTKLLLSDDCHT